MFSSRSQDCWPSVSPIMQPSSTSSGSLKCAYRRSQSASSASTGPDDGLRVGERGLLALAVGVGGLEVEQLVVLALDEPAPPGPVSERWLPQYSHLTLRET